MLKPYSVVGRRTATAQADDSGQVRGAVWGLGTRRGVDARGRGGRSRVVATGKNKNQTNTPHDHEPSSAIATCVRSQGSPERRDSAVVMVRVARHDVHEVVGSHLEVDVERREMSDAIGCH